MAIIVIYRNHSATGFPISRLTFLCRIVSYWFLSHGTKG